MNPFKAVRDFEKALCDYTGAPYAVCVESCSAALFLSCLFLKVDRCPEVTVPSRTYPSVAASIVNAGGRVVFKDWDWQKGAYYELAPLPLIDSAKFMGRRMYNANKGYLMCLSFHARKCLPIGRGGAVLTDNRRIADWLRSARHDGRHDGVSLKEDSLEMAGWNMLMTPEQASRGLCLMGNLDDQNRLPYEEYPDLSKYEFFTKANR